MEVTKKYIKISENPHDKCNFIKVYISYDLGGMNYFTGREKKRGYYITVLPVEKGGNMEGFTAFTGVCELLTECARKSKKAEQNALEKVPAYEKIIIDYICNKYGYVLEVEQ
jgi:hypothetical protein